MFHALTDFDYEDEDDDEEDLNKSAIRNPKLNNPQPATLLVLQSPEGEEGNLAECIDTVKHFWYF